ncbi:MAG: RNA methyltransferase [Ilumatobacteraceae bacterium]
MPRLLPAPRMAQTVSDGEPFTVIEAADDERLTPFRLKERGLASRADKRDDAGAGLFLAEGDLVVERALAAGCRPVAALADGERVPPVAHALAALGVDVLVGGAEIRRLVTKLGMPQAIVALFARPPRPEASALIAASTRLVVVEGVDNPSNIGSIVRNAAALGWNGLLLDHTSADPLSRRALRVAMGTAFTLPHARTRTLLDELSAAGDLDLYALTPDPSAVDIRTVDPEGRRAVVIGAERSGLSTGVLDACVRVRIPMATGVDSLNAAAAAAVACYALA